MSFFLKFQFSSFPFTLFSLSAYAREAEKKEKNQFLFFSPFKLTRKNAACRPRGCPPGRCPRRGRRRGQHEREQRKLELQQQLRQQQRKERSRHALFLRPLARFDAGARPRGRRNRVHCQRQDRDHPQGRQRHGCLRRRGRGHPSVRRRRAGGERSQHRGLLLPD